MKTPVPSILLASLVVLGLNFACKRAEKNAKENEVGTEDEAHGLSLNPSQYIRLQGFASCESSDSFLRENMRQLLKERFDEQRYNFERWRSSGMPGEVQTASTASAPEAAKADNSAPQDYSRTNTQVAGVDEPDTMKTDGKTIFAISGSNVQITASWPAASMQKIAAIPIEGVPQGLFLTENSKLVIVYHPFYQPVAGQISAPLPPPGAAYPWITRYGWPQLLRLATYDVAQPAQPRLLSEQSLWGQNLSLRRQGNVIRVVQTLSDVPFPEGVQTYIDTYPGPSMSPDGHYMPISLAEFDRRRAAVEQKNETLLANYSLKPALKALIQKSGARTDDPLLSDSFDCTEIYASQKLGQLGLTSITSVNIEDGQIKQATVLAPANQLYASEGSLYLAHTMHSFWWGWSAQAASKTYIHKFKYESPDSLNIAYQGSGMVDGFIINQYALDEHQDVLRVAVTVEPSTSPSVPVGPADGSSTTPVSAAASSINRVLTLAPGAEGLEELGRSPDLAAGERIYGVRFAGDKGYVVTFHNVDPLFVMDLRDPKAPKVVGELKISGYSSYIHMMDDTHLLTVGDEVDPNTLRRLGLKISVFDVSDPSKPVESFKYVAPDAYSSSQSLYDPHAFNWFASRKLLAIPVSGYRASATSSNWWDKYFAELQVFSVDISKGIEPKGAVAVNDLYQGQPVEWYAWQWAAQPTRSVFADDFIYAVSALGITAVSNQDLSTSLASARFYP